MYINSDLPGFPREAHAPGKPIRALTQRLKGKPGQSAPLIAVFCKWT